MYQACVNFDSINCDQHDVASAASVPILPSSNWLVDAANELHSEYPPETPHQTNNAPMEPCEHLDLFDSASVDDNDDDDDDDDESELLACWDSQDEYNDNDGATTPVQFGVEHQDESQTFEEQQRIQQPMPASSQSAEIVSSNTDETIPRTRRRCMAEIARTLAIHMGMASIAFGLGCLSTTVRTAAPNPSQTFSVDKLLQLALNHLA
ncbi:uncharacterized protein UTRI_01996 [Ustilago trichophora]|uniref:Uncharacterized protein n=1 Tax=Ustilago trichophora TaxID=86804 RepID=A0A5C3DYN2_9BASI|nr:uncharacterized protein UTRI_01996 [Ustilago trichophora]